MELVKEYPRGLYDFYSEPFKMKVISICKRSGLSLNIVAQTIGSSVSLVSQWDQQYGKVEFKSKASPVGDVSFYPVKVKDDKALTECAADPVIELLSPNGYIIKGLTSSSLVEVLRGLHV